MKTYEEAAAKVLLKLKDNSSVPSEVFIDPFTIMLIAQAISTAISAIKLYCEWKKGQTAAEGIVEMCQKPNMRARALVTRHVRKSLGVAKFREYGHDVVDAVFDAGANYSVSEMECLLNG